MNLKKVYRLYREEGLAVRRRRGRKRAIGARAPLRQAQRPNQIWVLDFMSDVLETGRRFRVFNVEDQLTREGLAAEVDTSLPGPRVVRTLNRIVAERGKPEMIVSDNVLRREMWHPGRATGLHSLSVVSDFRSTSIQTASAVKEEALGHSEHRVLNAIHWPSPSSTRDANPSGRPEHYLQGRGCALTAPAERGSPAWHRPFEEGPIIGTGFDDGMRGARHLGGNGSQRLALEIGVVAIPGDVALVLGSEAVIALADGDLGGNPEGASQSSIAELRQPGLTAKLAGLVGGEIEAAELQELAMMTEAAQVAGLGQDGHRDDRSDARNLPQALIVGVVNQCSMGLVLDRIALTDQAASFGEDQAEHRDCSAVERHRQADGRPCCLVDIAQQPGF